MNILVRGGAGFVGSVLPGRDYPDSPYAAAIPIFISRARW